MQNEPQIVSADATTSTLTMCHRDAVNFQLLSTLQERSSALTLKELQTACPNIDVIDLAEALMEAVRHGSVTVLKDLEPPIYSITLRGRNTLNVLKELYLAAKQAAEAKQRHNDAYTEAGLS